MGLVPYMRYTRNLFLRAFCTVYLSAFLSIYFQAPGLYGDNGILPARSVLENSKHKTWSAKIHYQPTLLWLAPFLGLSVSGAVEVLSLLGVFLSFTGILSQKFCVIPIFTALWSLYFSLFQVGQVFVSKSYDELLLEAGFIAICVAPFLPSRRKNTFPTKDLFHSYLCRLLLFKILCIPAIGKLLSGCPQWWSLSALSYHFETMPLPNPLSWYAHHLPHWFLKASTVYTIVCELFVPFIFFLPIRSARITAFYLELFLQICIVATGNFDFSNILIVTLLLFLLDDQFFFRRKKAISKRDIIDYVLNFALLVAVGFAIVKFFGIQYTNGILDANIAVTKQQFATFIGQHLGTFTIALQLLFSALLVWLLVEIAFDKKVDTKSNIIGVISLLFYAPVGLSVIFGSPSALLAVSPAANATIRPPYLHTVYNRLHKAHIMNHYNLFPKITGADGRPEIVLEGSDNLEGPWKEYNFLYKPGNVNHSLPFVAPYAPKLDWQMYWAAQSTYDKQPWLLSLAHRLLTGNSEVLNLIDRNHSPFPSKPPKYIRGVLYKYRYTAWSHRSHPSWWIREKVGEYFPPYTKDSPALEDFLKARNLWPSGSPEYLHPFWKQILDAVRFVANKFEATLLFWSVLTAALAIVATTLS